MAATIRHKNLLAQCFLYCVFLMQMTMVQFTYHASLTEGKLRKHLTSFYVAMPSHTDLIADFREN